MVAMAASALQRAVARHLPRVAMTELLHKDPAEELHDVASEAAMVVSPKRGELGSTECATREPVGVEPIRFWKGVGIAVSFLHTVPQQPTRGNAISVDHDRLGDPPVHELTLLHAKGLQHDP